MISDRKMASWNMINDAFKSPVILSASAFFILALWIRYLIVRPKRLNLPVLELGGPETYRAALMEATSKYQDTPFILPFDPPTIVLPIAMLNEVRNLPENQVSFLKEVQRMFHYESTGIGEDRPEIVATVKNDLTRHIASTLDALQDEIRYAFDKELGQCDNWNAVKLYPMLTRVVALLSGRVFVGRPLSREEDWIKSSIQYTMDCEAVRRAAEKYPSYLRRLVVPFLKETKRLQYHQRRGGELLEPILKECLEKQGKEKIVSEAYQDEQAVLISWILNRLDRSTVTPKEMADLQMSLSFAAIHTTTMTSCQAIYDLVSRPEYFQPLRDEIEQVIAEDGQDVDEEGYLKLKKTSLTKLRKLDSFLKESQRFNPPGLLSMGRVCTAPLTLSNGITLPKGTRFAFNSQAVHFSPTTQTFSPAYNPASNKPPIEFDGFRFFNLRSMPGKENRHQFVTTSQDSITFGHGNHACPGRFFASNEIKVLLIELLRSWDVRLKGDVEQKGGEDKRPANYETNMSVAPNMQAEVEFRRRNIQ